MSCFVGISVSSELGQQNYLQFIRQMQHYTIQAKFSIVPHQHLIIISNSHQQFKLSKNPQYLHNHLQHLAITEQNDENFLEVVVECLMILKEYFPSKIEIQLVSQLPQIYNLKKSIQQQIPRRLTGHLKMLAQKGRNQKLQPSEFDRLMYVLGDNIHKDYRHKLRLLALKILNQSKFDEDTWTQLTKERISIIDEISNDPLYQSLGIEVLEKIVRFNQFKGLEILQNSKQNINPNIQQQFQEQDIVQPEGKIDLKTAFFQLRESISLNRISRILQKILQSNISEKKQKKLQSIMRDMSQKLGQNFYTQATINEYKKLKKVIYNLKNSKGFKNNEVLKDILSIIQQKINRIQQSNHEY